MDMEMESLDTLYSKLHMEDRVDSRGDLIALLRVRHEWDLLRAKQTGAAEAVNNAPEEEPERPERGPRIRQLSDDSFGLEKHWQDGLHGVDSDSNGEEKFQEEEENSEAEVPKKSMPVPKKSMPRRPWSPWMCPTSKPGLLPTSKSPGAPNLLSAASASRFSQPPPAPPPPPTTKKMRWEPTEPAEAPPKKLLKGDGKGKWHQKSNDWWSRSGSWRWVEHVPAAYEWEEWEKT